MPKISALLLYTPSVSHSERIIYSYYLGFELKFKYREIYCIKIYCNEYYKDITLLSRILENFN